jgi:hypothetical protein
MTQHPVNRDLLVPIGDVTVSFALLEFALQTFIASMIREHQRVGQIVTAELSFKQARALAVSLYLERYGKDDDYKVLRSLLVDAAKLEAKRNRIVHSIWGAGDSPDSLWNLKSTAKERSGLRFDAVRYTVADLQAVADEIKALAARFQDFYISLIRNGKAINNPLEKMW